MALWFTVMAIRRVCDKLQEGCWFLWKLFQREELRDRTSASATQVDSGIDEPIRISMSANVHRVSDEGALDVFWRDLIENPIDWWDNRESRRNPRAPDFKHRITRQALWIDNWQTPAWARAKFGT